MDRYRQLSDRAAEFVSEFAASGPVLVLAPERAAADEVARLACTRALLGVQRLGFRELAPELAAAEMNRLELVPVGRVVREALAARVTSRTELTYLKPVAAFPGFPRALTDTFEELRLNGIRPEELRACGQSGPDLANLAAYEAELAQRRFADHALRVKLALAETHLTDTAVAVLDVRPHTCPAVPASIKASSEFHSGDVNNDSGLGQFAFHIPPESLFTSPRNPYSPFPGTLIHMARNTHLTERTQRSA
jgi:hypothetical protein